MLDSVMEIVNEKKLRVRPGAVWLVEDAEHRLLGYFVTVDNDAIAAISNFMRLLSRFFGGSVWFKCE